MFPHPERITPLHTVAIRILTPHLFTTQTAIITVATIPVAIIIPLHKLTAIITRMEIIITESALTTIRFMEVMGAITADTVTGAEGTTGATITVIIMAVEAAFTAAVIVEI